MLNKKNRLKSKTAFSATYKNKLIFNNEFIKLYVGKIKTDKNCPTRVGFVVSKKVSKRAVKRNKIKRLMRENIRLIIKNSLNETINKYQSLIFVAKEKALDLDFNEICNIILILLDKLANKNV